MIVAASLVVAGVVTAVLMIGNTAEPPLPVTNRPAMIQHERKPASLTASDRKAIVAVSRLFIRTAVRRDHPERAWPIASPALRAGTTLADWKAGTLPFAPYPVRSARWNLAYSVVGEVGLDVLVQPTDPKVEPIVHRLTLVRNTRSSKPAWLVDGWVPMTSLPGGFVAPQLGTTTGLADTPRSTPSPGRLWILAPFVVFLAAFAIPLVILVRSRRAERRVRRRLARPRPGPTSPRP
jgi:hypothetical protein